MPGHHVVYACNCLNIKIQLANKYYLDRHEQYRQSKFTRIEEPSLFGWLFELSTEGVVIVSTEHGQLGSLFMLWCLGISKFNTCEAYHE
jgi:hypothetical protein